MCAGRVNIVVRYLAAAAHQPRTNTHRDCWHKCESLEHGCRCIAAAVVLYQYTEVWLRD